MVDMNMMAGGPPMANGPSGGGEDLDSILIPKIQALPMELKKTLLDIINKMEAPTTGASPVEPGLEGNLTSMAGGM